MDGEEKEIPKYKNNASQDLESWRELQKLEDKMFNLRSKESKEKFSKELVLKNSYFQRTKKNDARMQDEETFKKKQDERSKGVVEENKEFNDFCKKCATNKSFCPHRTIRENLKDKYTYPILTSSTIGWLPPIDNFSQRNNLNSVTKQFFDCSHLNIHKH